VTQRTGLWTQAELEAKVPLLTATTPAERVGDWPEWAIVTATALAFLLAVTRAVTSRRREREARRGAADPA
jgi:apolipoprotein N-acyltransferase